MAQVYAWKDWGRPWNTPVGITEAPAKNQTGHLSYTSLGCYHYTNLLSPNNILNCQNKGVFLNSCELGSLVCELKMVYNDTRHIHQQQQQQQQVKNWDGEIFSKHIQFRQFLHMEFLPPSKLIPNKEPDSIH